MARSEIAQLLNDPKLLMQMSITPNRDQNGKISTYTISHILPGSLFERIGLKDGDIIASFNEQAIETFSSKQLFVETLENFTVGILRDGKAQTLKVAIK